MAYQRTEYPPWSWSSSRKSTFDECLRRYFYNYYLAHNGWEDDAPEESRLAYRLKNLTGIHMLLGSAVHEIAEHACKTIDASGKLPDKKKLIDRVREILNSAWKDSKKRDLWIESPKKYVMLQEFYYGGGLDESTIGKIKDKMVKSVDNIMISPTIKEMLKGDCSVRITEAMDTFDLFDTPVYAIPDLVFERPDKKWVVVDWKTGKEHDSHPSQINVYCMYLKAKFGVKEDMITGRVEYLLSGKTRDVAISKKSFNDTEKEIEKSIAGMKKCLADPDKNIPFGKDRYPLAKHTALCKWCSFYEMCREELRCR